LANWKIKMQNIGPKKKAGRKPKQKNALAKANAERRAASLKKITGKQAASAFSGCKAPYSRE
jgi:hypothetical protein